MGRTPSTKKDAAPTAEEKAEELESKRLRDLAFSRGLLSRFKANSASPLRPSKALSKAEGKDIVKKGHRKSKYLFSFPGLVTPVSGGKFGELTRLDSRNPILYVDFPQGRLKLFGTIVYPKNKYLALQFPRGTGNIICEDCFESLVLFSEGWWIGTKEENPEEFRLDWPKELIKDKYADVDFTAGAGRTNDPSKNAEKDEHITPEKQFKLDRFHEPEMSSESKDDFQDENETRNLPVRQSTRTAGKKLNYADSVFKDEGEDSDESDSSEHSKSKSKKQSAKKVQNTVRRSFGAQKEKAESSVPIMLDSDDDTAQETKKVFTGPSVAQKSLTSSMETVTAKASEGVSTASGLSGVNVSSTKLKQSTVAAFFGKSLKEEDMDLGQQSALVTNRKDFIQVSSKTTTRKRPRKSLSEGEKEDASSEDNSGIDKVTPSKGRKQTKIMTLISDQKGSDVKPRSAGSKRKLSQDGRGRQGGKSEEQKTESTPKGKIPASRKIAMTRTKKKGSESDEDLSDAEESDDSDEDWVG